MCVKIFFFCFSFSFSFFFFLLRLFCFPSSAACLCVPFARSAGWLNGGACTKLLNFEFLVTAPQQLLSCECESSSLDVRQCSVMLCSLLWYKGRLPRCGSEQKRQDQHRRTSATGEPAILLHSNYSNKNCFEGYIS